MKRILSLFVSALFAVGAWAEEPLSGEYVDLGLSVKWATCNLGATSSTDAGWYLAWGETSPKTNYTLGTYLSDLGGTMASYEDAGTEKDPLKEYVYGGANYSEGIGGTAYDAATAALGAGYRMPTLEEFEELANADNCEWVWYDEENDEFNGVAGYKVTSKKDGYTDKYIFLPAAGYRDGENLGDEGSDGNYWSSTPDTDYADGAYNFFFDTDFVIPDSYNNRHFGFTVRPVFDTQAAYNYLASLIGEKEYANSFFRIHVTDEGSITRDVCTGSAFHPFILNDLEVNGNEYFFPTNGIKFVVEEGAIAHVCEIYNGEIIRVYTETPSESELNTLFGSNVYVNAEASEEISVIDGYVTHTSKAGSYNLNSNYLLSKDGENYAFANNYNTFTFVVANGEVSEIVFKGYGGINITYVKKASTPTAIEAIDADKTQKVIKTIENGKVVIIRGDKKYDLSGREL